MPEWTIIKLEHVLDRQRLSVSEKRKCSYKYKTKYIVNGIENCVWKLTIQRNV